MKRIFIAVMLVLAGVLAPAIFNAQTADVLYTITVQKVGNGSGVVVSSPPGIDCGDGINNCTAQFMRGTPVTLRPRALHGPSQFQGWSVVVGSTIPCAGSNGDCNIIVTENSSVQAEFIQD